MAAKGFGMSKTVSASYTDTVAKVKDALKAEGFGVLCEIDVQATLNEKLGEEFYPYIIIGACNPPLAHRALQADPEIGLMLPCNVIVYETATGTKVSAIDPEALVGQSGNAALINVAHEVTIRLKSIVESI